MSEVEHRMTGKTDGEMSREKEDGDGVKTRRSRAAVYTDD